MLKTHLITGIPRSGTTLLTSTLASSLEAVVFSEPNWLKPIRAEAATAQSFTDLFVKKIDTLRNDIKNKQFIELKSSQFQSGQPSNYYIRGENGKIISDKSEQAVKLNPDLCQATFVIKSNAQFTACLNQLINTGAFSIHCIVRNPVAVVMSWRSLNIPVSNGNMKIAEKYHPEYLTYIESANNLLEKQVLMADWFFCEYQKYHDSINLITYESLINELSQIIEQQFDLNDVLIPKISNQNKSTHYNLSEDNEIRACFKDIGVFYKNFYPDL
jgi:hypothetical protein